MVVKSSAALGSFSVRRLVPLLLLATAGILFLMLGGRRYLSFAALAENSETMRGLVMSSPGLSALGFIIAYAGLTALSVPGGAMLTIIAGFLFGVWLGLLYVVVGATVGAAAIFLVVRFGLGGLAERAGPRAN